MKFILYVPFFLIFANTAMSKGSATNLLTESMKQGVKKLGEKCMKSVGATMEEMNSIRYGPPYKGKTACAIACILDKAGIMADKKFSKKGFVKAVTPFLLGDPKKLSHMREISNDCEKELATVKNECEAANHIIECLRKNIPQISEIEFTKA